MGSLLWCVFGKCTNMRSDPFTGMTVAVGVVNALSAAVLSRIVEQPHRVIDNLGHIRSNQGRRPRLDRLEGARFLAQHQHRLAQRRCFLLNPPESVRMMYDRRARSTNET